MNVNQYFSYSVVPEKKNKVYVVVEHYSAEHQKTIGVITGGESVCVVNSGMGMNGDLRKFIEDMLGTDKTIECISLTGQPGDVGASALFDAAYLTEQQRAVYLEQGCNEAERKRLFAGLSCNNAESLTYGDVLMLDNRNIQFKEAGDGISTEPVEIGPHMFDKSGDGYAFHLGGTVVQMAELPAQYEGQLVAVSPTCCITFAGDAIDSVTHLENLNRAGLKRYADCLERVIAYSLADTNFSEGMAKTPPAFYCSRTSVPMGVDVPQDILAACREVLDGKTKHDAPAGGKDSWRMHYVNNNCIVYDAEKIS